MVYIVIAHTGRYNIENLKKDAVSTHGTGTVSFVFRTKGGVRSGNIGIDFTYNDFAAIQVSPDFHYK